MSSKLVEVKEFTDVAANRQGTSLVVLQQLKEIQGKIKNYAVWEINSYDSRIGIFAICPDNSVLCFSSVRIYRIWPAAQKKRTPLQMARDVTGNEQLGTVVKKGCMCSSTQEEFVSSSINAVVGQAIISQCVDATERYLRTGKLGILYVGTQKGVLE